jgi:O-methyltransferase involved in polyketide biosynthesis
MIPALHLFDRSKAKDSAQALTVLWCKALASLDKASPVYNDWSFDMMPPSRWLLKIFSPFFPRLHHANIELRTIYLNQAIENVIATAPPDTRVRLVSLGAGYDVRSTRLLSTGRVQEAWDLDLPQVIESKVSILERLKQRRENVVLPEMRSVDLNNLAAVEANLSEILSQDNDANSWHTIFLTEGVLLFLNKGKPTELLKLCRDFSKQANNTASFCFADYLETVTDCNEDMARYMLNQAGWELQDWCPKPGRAKHMGIATLL